MKRLPFFLAMESCPRRCVYCHQGEITGVWSPPSPAGVGAEISRLSERAEICFFGGSFTCLPVPRQKEYLDRVLKAPSGSRVRLSTHPDCINPSILEFLSRYPVSMIELGISSLDDRVLSLCNRGYRGEKALAALEMVLDGGFHGGAQMMIGLPGQTGESSFSDLRRIAAMARGRPVTLRIYPCLVLRGTALENMLKEDAYSPLSVEEAALWSARLLALSRRLGLPVQRVGLHESDTLGASVVAGPYHPAFGELARAAELALSLAAKSKEDPWSVPRNSISLVTGHDRYGLRVLAGETGLALDEAAERIHFTDRQDLI
ncbi:MAG: radical SAM protein [Synergistaceae bacterium]|nr:radical SAM protein [Synergistaceae bacterium]